MKIFCYNCGSKIEFSATNKPKFCMSCGASLDPNSNTKANTSSEPQEDLESEQGNFSADISKLDFDFIPDESHRVKLGEALGSNSGGRVDENPLQPRSISEEEFNKQWAKESGTLRGSPPQESNE